MSNDNKKTKNNAPCEEKQEARKLTEEELEQVTGGLAPQIELDPGIETTGIKPSDLEPSAKTMLGLP